MNSETVSESTEISEIELPRRSALLLELSSGRIRPMRPSCPPVSIRQTFGEGLVFEEHPAGRSAAHRISLLQPVVFLTLSGRTSVDWTDGCSTESRIVNAGRFSLLPANSPYTVRLRTTGATALVSFPCPAAATSRTGTFPWVHGDMDGQVRELVLALRSIAAATNEPTSTNGSALSHALIAHLNQRFGTDRSASDLPARSSGLPAVVLAKALRFVEEHLERPVLVADIADAVGLSESHFARRFRTSMGTPPHRHLMQRRVALGKSLLAQGLSTVDAALRAGFYDQPHFCRCFREIEGTTPSRFIADLPSDAIRDRFSAGNSDDGPAREVQVGSRNRVGTESKKTLPWKSRAT